MTKITGITPAVTGLNNQNKTNKQKSNVSFKASVSEMKYLMAKNRSIQPDSFLGLATKCFEEVQKGFEKLTQGPKFFEYRLDKDVPLTEELAKINISKNTPFLTFGDFDKAMKAPYNKARFGAATNKEFLQDEFKIWELSEPNMVVIAK